MAKIIVILYFIIVNLCGANFIGMPGKYSYEDADYDADCK